MGVFIQLWRCFESRRSMLFFLNFLGTFFWTFDLLNFWTFLTKKFKVHWTWTVEKKFKVQWTELELFFGTFFFWTWTLNERQAKYLNFELFESSSSMNWSSKVQKKFILVWNSKYLIFCFGTFKIFCGCRFGVIKSWTREIKMAWKISWM